MCMGRHWGQNILQPEQPGKPGIDLLESRTVEGDRGTRGASDGGEKGGAGAGAPRHVDEYG
jgi:hypothetical protein